MAGITIIAKLDNIGDDSQFLLISYHSHMLQGWLLW